MDFEVGDKVVRKSTLELGSVQSTRRAKALMVEVKWDATGVKQWLPAEEFQPWDKSELPPPPYVSPWGRTTPGYIIGIRSSAQVRDERKNRLSQPSKKSLENIADSLCSLGKKNKSKNKARRLIRNFNKVYARRKGDSQ